MSRAAAVAAVAVALALWPAGPASACSCVAESAKQKAKGADAVFVGVVERVRGDGRAGIVARLAVETVYKGEVGATASVRTPPDPAQCGIAFVPERRYAVFAAAGDGELRADICGGTSAKLDVLADAGLSAAADPEAEAPAASGGSGISTGLIVGAAAGLAALLLVRARAARASTRRRPRPLD